MTKRSIASCYKVEDFRELARKRLPSPMFHYIDGAAEDEWTYRRNTLAFNEHELVPRFLIDVENIDTSVEVLGQKISWPFLCSPTGFHRLFHHDGESGAGRAASRAGTIFCLSTISTTTIEEVAQSSEGPKVFQIYVLRDRGLSEEYIERCKEANYDALCLTVDVPSNGRRERDLRTGMTVPPRLTIRSYLDIATHLDWSFNYLLHKTPSMVNIEHKVPKGTSDISVMDFMNNQFDRSVTWEDAAWMIKKWNKPFAIKGILSVEDAKKAVDVGASAIMVSNHGGRQMDGCPAPIEVLAEVVAAVGDEVEVILDGGIRRGTHILKAIAMGARACMGGRAYLYGLAAGGEEGAYRSLNLLKEEVHNNMILLGTRNLKEISFDHLRRI